MTLLREGTRIFLDASTTPQSLEGAFSVPASALPATLLYMSDRVARLILETPKSFRLNSKGVLYRKVRFGLFGAPFVVENNEDPSPKLLSVRLLNPGAVLQRREFVRVSTVLGVSIFVLEDDRAIANFTAVAIDISQGGMRIKTSHGIRDNERIRISFLIEGTTLTVYGRLKSRFPDQTYGFEFDSISDSNASKICRYVFRTQVAQNPQLGKRASFSDNDGGSTPSNSNPEEDEYWDIFKEGTLSSIAVSTDYRDFNKTVFGAFNRFSVFN
ncbi:MULTISPECIES: PilZ domain-containing protein [Acidithrix]|uniref:PilZ domain protein n=1 Tax=Acidithrix ferrooxidans TaxID=1280514 RepID=A0A0D8HGG1_9ACTN|nr:MULTISPECIES: PilZ domain-containing protein [Acidithrix]KJF17080.1 PilZ domain protein [Acidithrix ferrooxidans]